jgi:hypothetical protein
MPLQINPTRLELHHTTPVVPAVLTKKVAVLFLECLLWCFSGCRAEAATAWLQATMHVLCIQEQGRCSTELYTIATLDLRASQLACCPPATVKVPSLLGKLGWGGAGGRAAAIPARQLMPADLIPVSELMGLQSRVFLKD